ncbi:MAG: hypothetical protein ACRC46_11645 [Thermoguttaceae bacterium]
MLEREEYIEQAFFFEAFRARLEEGLATQEILLQLHSEILVTSKLLMAVDFLRTDVKLTGSVADAMRKIPHYFTSFQAYTMGETENATGRFDVRIALQVLAREAEYRSSDRCSVQGVFFYQLETICHNRLGYEHGLTAVAADPIYDAAWRDWIDILQRQLGLIELADMIYVRSEAYARRDDEPDVPVLFGKREGRIAHATRKRDPSYLFAALARHLGYPTVPRAVRPTDDAHDFRHLQRRIELLDNRLQLLEEEARGGIDLNRIIVKE